MLKLNNSKFQRLSTFSFVDKFVVTFAKCVLLFIIYDSTLLQVIILSVNNSF